MSSSSFPIVIIGAGIAGLSVALHLAPCPVLVVTAGGLGEETATGWAQGGVAAALSEDDCVESHSADTLLVGRGLCVEACVERILRAAPGCIETLERWGVPLDRTAEGAVSLGLEGGHSHRRIVHAGGDQTGSFILKAMVAEVRRTPSITVWERVRVTDLVTEEGRIAGVRGMGDRGLFCLRTSDVVLATGGVGGLYATTTNPLSALGMGLGMAVRAGATLADVEFVQFHPTALIVGDDPLPLASEALRGEGAWLINGRGERFLKDTPRAELSGRDVVARAIWHELSRGEKVFLDARPLGPGFRAKFPSIMEVCLRHGLDPVRTPIPIRPAAHYHVGGIATDVEGRTSLSGLWACGEVASTGLHGANRLASNSMLEGLVCGKFLAQALGGEDSHRSRPPSSTAQGSPVPSPPFSWPYPMTLRTSLEKGVGIVRDGDGIRQAIFEMLTPLFPNRRAFSPAQIDNPTLAALSIATGALNRRESLGCHYRSDCPDAGAPKRAFLTQEHLLACLKDIFL